MSFDESVPLIQDPAFVNVSAILLANDRHLTELLQEVRREQVEHRAVLTQIQVTLAAIPRMQSDLEDMRTRMNAVEDRLDHPDEKIHLKVAAVSWVYEKMDDEKEQQKEAVEERRDYRQWRRQGVLVALGGVVSYIATHSSDVLTGIRHLF